MRIIYAGVADFSAAIFSYLIDSPNQILALITSEDKRAKRGNRVHYSACKKIALAKNIAIIQTANINQREPIAAIRALEPDLLIVCSFGQILSDQLLAIPKYGSLNIHTSILPKYRGASPIQSAILNGEKQTGVSLMKMVSELDAGALAAVEKVNLAVDETYFSLSEKLIEKSKLLLADALPKINNQTIRFHPQNKEQISYCQKITKKDAQLNFKMTSDQIDRIIRAFYPSLIGYCQLNLAGQKLQLKIHRARSVGFDLIQSLGLEADGTSPASKSKKAGGLIFNKNRLFVICNSNFNQDDNQDVSQLDNQLSYLELLEVQLANKNKIKASELIGSKLMQFKKSFKITNQEPNWQNLIYLD